tara:strand:+ start:147 stop:671 length:525 start_codon:yes stop_codon:yes gene_type:complete
MPNAILRAGPFATRSDPFRNEPTSFGINTLPVNCANFANYYGATNWPWKFAVLNQGTGQYLSQPEGDEQAGASFPSSTGFIEGDGIFFAYQAATSFTLTGAYEGSVGSQQGSFITFDILNGDDQSLFSDTDDERINGNFSITLPAATVPYFLYLKLTGEGSFIADTNINVDLII